MVNENGISNFIDRTFNRSGSRMVFNSGTDGDICGSGNPDCDYGIGSGDRQAGDCSMVAPELEDYFTMDEILSDLIGISADGDHVSGYLRFSQQGTS